MYVIIALSKKTQQNIISFVIDPLIQLRINDTISVYIIILSGTSRYIFRFIPINDFCTVSYNVRIESFYP